MTVPEGVQAGVEGASEIFDPEEVRAEIERILSDHHELIAPHLEALDAWAGKMVRPRFLLIFADLFGGADRDTALTCSACCELLHTATLLHDDVIDQAERRRGVETARSILGNEVAVIVGDYVLASMLKTLNRQGDLELNAMLLDTSQELGMGVIEEIVNKNNFELGREHYLRLVELKTASLFRLACRMGAYLGGAGEREREHAAGYGQHFGIAFQLVDDLLDIVSDPEVTGKPVFADLSEGRITLPLIYALEEERERTEELIAAFQRGDAEQRDALLELIREADGIRRTIELADEHRTKARQHLIKISHHKLTPEKAERIQRVEDKLYALLPDRVTGYLKG